MLIKSADDKSKRLALLENLQKSSLLDTRQKDWLRTELRNLKAGIKGEQAAAFYLNGHYKDGQNNVLLHDLRFQLDDEVAQIDHLVINRTGYMVLIETKNYSGDLEVNEFHNVVMMHPQAIIQRPDSKTFDTSFLIKADQFPAWHEKLADGFSTGGVLKALFNIRSPDTIKEWGQKLKRQHRPADLLALPEFMQPKAAPVKAAPIAQADSVKAEAPQDTDETLVKTLVCAHCGSKISFPEGKYCWNNAKRFGGVQYCREHQGLFA